jgi:hypothetical protein
MINFSINPYKFKSEVESLPENLVNNKYIKTYSYLLNYFQRKKALNIEEIVVGCHAIYGWMPTTLEMHFNGNEQEIIEIIKAAKHSFIDFASLEKLKKVVNNSLVGSSKLLHFMNPGEYAIWDSKIIRYFSGNKTSYGVDKIENYFKYLEAIKSYSNSDNFKDIKPEIEKIGGKISDLRAIEMVLFYSVTGAK